MENNHSAESNGVKSVGSRCKTPGIPASTRLQRNLAEKERRDKLNGYISELATLVPMVSNASKPLDKVSILRLAAAEMRLHFSCLNPKKYKKKTVKLPPSIMSYLDLIEKSIGGFVIVTTLSGLIVFCSKSIEDCLGYQNIDVMGNKVTKYIYEDDLKYFESKVNSVVSSLKKSHKKKTKIIRAHMLQKPLPRSSEPCRHRNMVFKISALQNDPSENGKEGSSSANQSPSASKSRQSKDFGYSAVVLFYIEPVRLEPEIDITYIDSNQDVYFTRHGLRGEIIYADQRISTITGYMPHEVHGTSAYQYICSSDVPIALFAQKSMFTSTDGKGDIVYRLRIRDMRYIYLQSSGQIAYKDGTSEISHFVCLNRLLSEEEGCQELKKFQQRFAPQIMAAQMVEMKTTNGPSSSTRDTSYKQVEAVMNTSMTDITIPVAQANSLQSSDNKISFSSNIEDEKNALMSVPDSPSTSSSIHSSETHSSISPVKSSPGSSVVPDFSEQQYTEIVIEKPGLAQTLRNDCTLYPASPFETAVGVAHKKGFQNVLFKNLSGDVNQAVVHEEPCFSESIVNVNESYKAQQNCQYISVRSRNKISHSVNADNSLPSSICVNGFGETLNGSHMELMNPGTSQKTAACHLNSTVQNSTNTYCGQSSGLLSNSGDELDKCVNYVSLNKTQDSFNEQQKSLRLPGIRPLELDVLSRRFVTFDSEQISQNKSLQVEGNSNFTQDFRLLSETATSFESSSYLHLASELTDAVDYSANESSYHEGSNYSRKSFPSTVNNYKNLAVTVEQNGLDANFKPQLTRHSDSDTNGFHVSDTDLTSLKTISSIHKLRSLDVEMNVNSKISPPVFEDKMDFQESNYSENWMEKPPTSSSQAFSSDSFFHLTGEEFSIPPEWKTTSYAGNMDTSVNKELFQELDLFFQQFPQSSSLQGSGFTEPVSDFSDDYSTYPQSSISSIGVKTTNHQ